MPFIETQIDLKIIIASEISQRKTNIIYYLYAHSGGKKDTNKLISKTERDSQTQKMNLPLPKGKRGWGEDKLGAWD